MDGRKQQLLSDIDRLLTMECTKAAKKTDALQELKDDIENDFFTVVVLGEFKRGKSTFVNALLGKRILPSDVLPETATINAIMYSETPELSVVMQDGSEEKGAVTEEFLRKFSAQNPEAIAEKVKYIKIGYPAEILKPQVVIVDTPGVSDINESRCEVTYRFLPKANAILFLLDANSPLKKTEKDFIDQHLLPMGVDRILFLANKYDDVDEEEDGDLLGSLERRLREAFKMETAEAELKELCLLPLSARMALEGIEQGDDELIGASGIQDVTTKLRETLFSGSVEARKIYNYIHRLTIIIENVQHFLQNERKFRMSDEETLRNAAEKMQKMLEEEGESKKNIEAFVQQEKQPILAMADKSLAYFQQRMTESVIDNVRLYKGADFKEYVEERISHSIRRELEGWVAAYSPHVDRLLQTMERELARGLTYHFHQNVQLQTTHGEMQTESVYFDVSVSDASGTNIKAGALAAGGAGLMMMIGAPILCPFISMAAFPLLQKSLLDSKLAEVKSEAIPAIQVQIDRCVTNLKQEIHRHIEERCKNITANAEYAYENILADMQQRINEELRVKEQEQAGKRREISDLDGQLGTLKDILSKYGRV